MKNNFQYALLIRFFMILNVFPEFFGCQDICKQPELNKFENLISQSDSYRYSHYFSYSQRIRLNQFHPVVNGSFTKIYGTTDIELNFPFKYYSNHVKNLSIYTKGEISIYGDHYLGDILSFITSKLHYELEVLNTKELFVVKSYIIHKVDPIYVATKITNLIYPNGKISIYFETVPTDVEKTEWISEIKYQHQCGKNVTEFEILVPVNWITSGTLVEFEVIGETCPKYNSTEVCQKAKSSNMKCIWCEKAKKCIESNDQGTHELKVNDCRIKKTRMLTIRLRQHPSFLLKRHR
ncbi:unnamed protein product [Schistosoma mattheei]|uniref:Egg protein CP391S-like protein n=1 Tax=Schistosoma mattheei TaxID=31246 RepID=A0AA85BZV7_9TREM|nr:unnamed protein product [Schistosoma mattheei]